MNLDDSHSGEGSGDQPQLRIDYIRASKTRTRLTTRLGDELIHQDEINLNQAVARARYAAKIAERTQFEQKEIEERLLPIAAELSERFDQDDNLAAESQHHHNDVSHDDSELCGLYRGQTQLTNFTLEISADVVIEDEIEERREFHCRAVLDGTTSEFTVAATDFASGVGLIEAIFNGVGPRARILCKPQVLRTAVSAVSDPESRILTSDFGWTKANDAYVTPSLRIDTAGIHPVGSNDPRRVDLSGEQCARHLDLAAPKPQELRRLKKHIVGSFLPLHDRRVTYTLLAATALAVLFRFATGANRPAIWLVGLTGGGKSFLARLAMNFFGDFPLSEGGRVGSWTSSWKFLQREGSFFRDALFVIDDYKPEVTSHRDVVTLTQNYADSSGRGRLKVDATSNVTRPIRGILLSTGEDVPENAASALARSIIVRTPSVQKDTKRGRRCLKRCARYRVVLAAFIHHLISHERTSQFGRRVQAEADRFYKDIVGAQNDLRIASNMALLAAAFREFAEFLADVWPEWQQQSNEFVGNDLIALRDEMLAAARGQQASQVFLSVLSTLVLNGHVQIQNWQPLHVDLENLEHRPIVGRRVACLQPTQIAAFDIATQIALGAVQDSLRHQGRPLLAVTEKTLITQLANSGTLLDKDNSPFPPEAGGDHTWPAKLAGATKQVFRLRTSALVEEPPVHGPAAQPAVGGQGEQPL